MLVQSKPLLRVWLRLQTLARKMVHISEILHIEQTHGNIQCHPPIFTTPIFMVPNLSTSQIYTVVFGDGITLRIPANCVRHCFKPSFRTGGQSWGTKTWKDDETTKWVLFRLQRSIFCWGHLIDTHVVLLKSWLLSFAMKLLPGPFAMQLSMWIFKKETIWWLTKRPINPKAAEVNEWTHA